MNTSLPTKTQIKNHLAIDNRALAALRILIGSTIILSVIQRAGYISIHYTDKGVYPTSLLRQEYPLFAALSIYAIIDDPAIHAILFLITGILALLVMLGIYTKPALLGSYLLLISLYARNPHMISSAEALLCILILIAFFLPLTNRWALRTRGKDTDNTYFSAATAFLLLQYVYVLFSNGLVKLKGTMWPNGTAMHYVLHLDQYTYLLGDHLAEIPALHTPLTYTWLALLLLSPLLIILGGWLRATLTSMYIASFIGMALAIDVWIFPVVLITGAVVFIPGVAWDVIDSRLPDVTIGEKPGFLEPDISIADTRSGFNEHRDKAARASFLVIVVFLVFINMPFLTFYIPVDEAQASQSDRWRMFAPDPANYQIWFDVEVDTASGQVMDGVTLREYNESRPDDLNDLFPTTIWRMHMTRMSNSDERARAFTEAMCHRVSSSTTLTPLNATVTLHREYIEPTDGYGMHRTVELAETQCQPV